MATVTKPPILDETGQAIVTALGNVSIRPQIVDNLTTADANKALSANMGNSLKTNIDGLSNIITTVNDNVNAIKPTVVIKSNDITRSTSVQRLEDVAVTVPANCYYVATAQFFYNHAKPSIIGIGYVGGSNYDSCVYEYRDNSSLGVNHPKITVSGYTTDSSVTLCPYGSWGSNSSNRVNMHVIYFPTVNL